MKKVDEIKMLCELIKEGNATIEQEIRYNVLMIDIANKETECGKRMIERHIQELKRLNQLKIDLLNANKEIICEVVEVESSDIVDLEDRFVKRISQVKDMKFRKGDEIKITFKDGSRSEGKINNVCFGQYYKNCHYTNKDKDFKMYIDYKKVNDKEIYVADIEKVDSINIISRSQRSKKVLLEDNKSLKSYIAYWGR